MLCTYAKPLSRVIVSKNVSIFLFKPSLMLSASLPAVSPLSSFSYRRFSSISDKNSSNQGIPSTKNISSPQQIIYNNPKTDIFIAGLDRLATEETLKEIFKVAGEIVSIKIPITTDGTLKGYAFIRFADAKSVKSAIALSGQNYLGNIINVVGITNQNEINNRQIFVGNISKYVTQEELRQHFSQYGEILRTYIITDNQGNSKRYGFVKFINNEAARKACSSLGFELKGRALYVKIAPENANASSSGNINRYERKDTFRRDRYEEKDEEHNRGVDTHINERKETSRRDRYEGDK